jgi:mRNA-decapping enzyme subunit 1
MPELTSIRKDQEESTKISYNYAVLLKHDPYLAQIICSSTICNVYKFNLELAEWEKLNCLGTLFVYSRVAKTVDAIGDSKKYPYGLIVLNRLNLENFSLGISPVSRSRAASDPEMEVKLEDPFIMVQACDGAMYGLWLFNEADREPVLSTMQWCLSQTI